MANLERQVAKQKSKLIAKDCLVLIALDRTRNKSWPNGSIKTFGDSVIHCSLNPLTTFNIKSSLQKLEN